MTPLQRLAELGLDLPPPGQASANYLLYRLEDGLLYLAGHGPRLPDGTYRKGKIAGADQVQQGYEDAKLTALNMLSTAQDALGDLSRVKSVVRVFGMVNAAPDFALHPKVIDGCSDLLVAVLGAAGRHPRCAVGMGSLPHGMSVEVEAIFAVAPAGGKP